MRVPLQEWISTNNTPDHMYWKGAAGEQLLFVRDWLQALVGVGLDYEGRKGVVYVIAEHRSKSIVLPVYSLERPDLGLTFTLRNNFYNWKLSVKSEQPITKDPLFAVLFRTTPPSDPGYTGDELAGVYFEGFPVELIFGYLDDAPDGKLWSACIGTDYELWTTLLLILHQRVDIAKRWPTRKTL